MTMVQVPEGTAVSLQVNIMSNRKKVILTKGAPLSSHLALYCLSDSYVKSISQAKNQWL